MNCYSCGIEQPTQGGLRLGGAVVLPPRPAGGLGLGGATMPRIAGDIYSGLSGYWPLGAEFADLAGGGAELPWQRSLLAAQEQALKEGKPIFLYFTKTY